MSVDYSEWENFINSESDLQVWTDFYKEADPIFSDAWAYATSRGLKDSHREKFAYAVAMKERICRDTSKAIIEHIEEYSC